RAVGGVGSGRPYPMVRRHRAATERRLEHDPRARAASFCTPVVAGTEVLYHTRGRRELQDVMTCIRHGVTLSTAGRRIRSNAGHALLAPHAFRTLFADDPLAVQQGLEIAARCRFSLDEIRYRYPRERLPAGTDSAAWLR